MKKLLIVFSIAMTACTESESHSDQIETPFNKQKWLTDIPSRASMLKDFLSKHDVTAQDRTSLELLLGNADGYYLYDEFPAYRLKQKGDCVIAFPINRKTGKIEEALIQPKGCAIQAN